MTYSGILHLTCVGAYILTVALDNYYGGGRAMAVTSALCALSFLAGLAARVAKPRRDKRCIVEDILLIAALACILLLAKQWC